jgi:hypothetical protein
LDDWFLNSVAFCGGLGGNDDELSGLEDPFAQKMSIDELSFLIEKATHQQELEV